MRWYVLAMVLVLGTLIATNGLLWEERVGPPSAAASTTCPKKPGLLAGPFVDKAETARAIFQAVARGLRGDASMNAYNVNVRDEVDHWTVYQSLRPEPGDCEVAPPGTTTCSVTSGGGGLEMHIDKCTGAISHAHYAR